MQSNTLLAVMLFVVQCIDRSFEGSITTTLCTDDAKCIEMVYDHFREGLFPVLVTLDNSPQIEDQISRFFDSQDKDISMLKVIVDGPINKAVATCLYPSVRSPADIHYPFVVAMKDLRIMDPAVDGYDPQSLIALFYSDYEVYKPNSGDFLYEMYRIVQRNPFTTIRADIKEYIEKKIDGTGTSAPSSVYGNTTGEQDINTFRN